MSGFLVPCWSPCHLSCMGQSNQSTTNVTQLMGATHATWTPQPGAAFTPARAWLMVRWPAIAISGLLEMRQLNSITQSCPIPHSAQTEMQRLKSFAQLILAWWSRRTLSLCFLDMSSIWSYHNEGLALWGGISLQSSRRAIQFYGACWNFVLS